MNNRLFVGSLPYDTTEDSLREAFAPFGDIQELTLALDGSGEFRGFGFVTYETEEAAEEAKTAMHRADMGSRSINVDWANTQKTVKERSARKSADAEVPVIIRRRRR